MSGSPFANTPEPPYYAVIFTTRRTEGDTGYAVMAEAMDRLAATMTGYLGVESARGTDGVGITVSYWESEAAIDNWKRNAEHVLARDMGRADWYAHYELRVARVERAYRWTKP
ncbi:MAG: antibiotic biosynthesis monooxygenase [Proteobacteria bacterium]|nr:antibiotic biosynthesis monooxygenase [Pseudomonadota bacterium]